MLRLTINLRAEDFDRSFLILEALNIHECHFVRAAEAICLISKAPWL